MAGVSSPNENWVSDIHPPSSSSVTFDIVMVRVRLFISKPTKQIALFFVFWTVEAQSVAESGKLTLHITSI